jgi:hypothetical protein
LRTAGIAAAMVAALACKTPPPDGGDAGSGSSSASGSASAIASSPPTSEPDKIRPVYPLDAGLPEPLAERLCAALQETPVKRRAACCSTAPGVLVTSECVRMLSAAIHFGALTVAPADVDACVAALDRTFTGCDWVGPNAPQPPAECQGLIHGTLADGAKCRSSLECKDGLRCQGVGPTDTGTCASPRDDGSGCGASVDALATYARQNGYEAQHPECKGFCDRHRCAPAAALGAACRIDVQCGPGHACVGGKCASAVGGARPPPRKPAGEGCTSDAECTGGCLREGGAGRGTCGMKCP